MSFCVRSIRIFSKFSGDPYYEPLSWFMIPFLIRDGPIPVSVSVSVPILAIIGSIGIGIGNLTWRIPGDRLAC